MNSLSGVIKRFDPKRGVGSLIGDDDLEFVFSVVDINGDDVLGSGDVVVFDVSDDEKRKAISIELVSKYGSDYRPKSADSIKDSGDRVVCKKCGKKIVPRVITGPPAIIVGSSWTPVPKKSICPFCGCNYKIFSQTDDIGRSVAIVIGAIILIALFVSAQH